LNLDELFIHEEMRVIDAMETLDKRGKKILFVVENRCLLATLTDGDVRRWILKNGDLHMPVKAIANYSPKYMHESTKANAKEFMKSFSIEALPIVDDQKQIVSVVFWDDQTLDSREKLDLPVVIMAGGLGTRLFPYTKILPKPLIPIGELPIAQHIIDQFRTFGITRFFMVVNHKKNMIKAYFNEIDKNYDLAYIDEDVPLGTGGGLSLLKGKIDSTFILSNCDILIDTDFAKLVKHHRDQKNRITMVCSLKKVKIPYGVVEIDEEGQISSMREKPELSFFTNTGIYIVEPEVVDAMIDGEVIGFPDILTRHQLEGAKVGIYPISENAWMDMGELDQMEEMRLRLNRNE
jgi:dTDP-glucose pyrophosphorylase